MIGRIAGAALAVGLSWACPALAQQPAPVTPGQAKKPQAAPKPARLADGHPNWTGFWAPLGGLLDRDFSAGAKAAPPPPPPPGGATGPQIRPGTNAPLKSPYKEKYAAILAATARGEVLYDPAALCLPPGMPRMMNAIYGIEILQTPGQVTITSEWQAASRRIWMDGRKHPNAEETLSTYAGHSIGHWEGEVLVVDTVQVRPDSLIEQSGLPHSEDMHVIERLHQTEPGILVDEITIDDPAVYEKPWTMMKRYRFRPDLSLQEYVCEENNRNVGENGAPTFK